ncbi:MAG TPA: hypothetical protein VF154_14150, partial [Terriglobales bacterium]
MRKLIAIVVCLLAVSLVAQEKPASQEKLAPPDNAPALTIYNQNFFVARELLPLSLRAGVNHVQYEGMTSLLEPDSVILRDPAGRALQILEQNYRNDPISQELLLSMYEGKTIDFLVPRGEHSETVRGKIIRSGYVPSAS